MLMTVSFPHGWKGGAALEACKPVSQRKSRLIAKLIEFTMCVVEAGTMELSCKQHYL